MLIYMQYTRRTGRWRTRWWRRRCGAWRCTRCARPAGCRPGPAEAFEHAVKRVFDQHYRVPGRDPARYGRSMFDQGQMRAFDQHSSKRVKTGQKARVKTGQKDWSKDARLTQARAF